jgi:hypothetical protein
VAQTRGLLLWELDWIRPSVRRCLAGKRLRERASLMNLHHAHIWVVYELRTDLEGIDVETDEEVGGLPIGAR